MSLIVLQGVMGGLQSNLKNRSKKIIGDYVLFVDLKGRESIDRVSARLKTEGFKFRIEYEHEGLIRFGNIVTPVKLNGIYGENDLIDVLSGPTVPYEVLSILGASPGQSIEFFSPSYTDSFFADLPRSFSISIKNVVSTRVPEIDSTNLWLSSNALNNFTREIRANRVRLYSDKGKEYIKKNVRPIFNGLDLFSIKSWDELHSSLVWALKLEKMMMTFLFLGMCFLVCISISSAILVFIKRVNKDLTALWVLGASKLEIYKCSKASLFKICLISITSGVLIGMGILLFIDKFGGNVMPDIFVERKIPVHFNFTMFVYSFFIPSILTFIFIQLGLNEFKNETDYLKNVRSIGQV